MSKSKIQMRSIEVCREFHGKIALLSTQNGYIQLIKTPSILTEDIVSIVHTISFKKMIDCVVNRFEYTKFVVDLILSSRDATCFREQLQINSIKFSFILTFIFCSWQFF